MKVDGQPFATYTVEPVDEPAKFYGARYVVRIRPELGPQSAENWSEKYAAVCDAIYSHVSQN